jgi:hypothetical protein
VTTSGHSKKRALGLYQLMFKHHPKSEISLQNIAEIILKEPQEVVPSERKLSALVLCRRF